jgi:predicted dehydrogenase
MTTGRDSIVRGIPDVAFMNLRFPSGLVANVELSWLAPSKLRRTVIVGSKKMVVYDDTSSEPVRVFDSGVHYQDPETFGEYQLSYRTGDILSPRLETSEPLALELADFLDSLRSGNPVTENRRVAREVVTLIEAAEASLEERGAPIALPAVGATV